MKYFLQSFSSFHQVKKDCYQLQVNVCALRQGYPLSLSLPRTKSVVMLTDRLEMNIAIDWDVKPQIKKGNPLVIYTGLSQVYYIKPDGLSVST